MRTMEQELEFQVIDIFNQFYKDEMERAEVSSFRVHEDTLEGMLDADFEDGASGSFYHSKLEDEIFYKLIIRDNKRVLTFVRLDTVGG